MDYRFTKVWLSENYELVFQIRPNAEHDTELKKLFLYLDISQSGFGVRIHEKKPQKIMSTSGFIQRVRKCFGSGKILSIVRVSDELKDIEVQIGAQSKLYILRMKYTKPPYFDLIEAEAKKSLMRYGQKGMFTKAQKIESMEEPLGVEVIPEFKVSESTPREEVKEQEGVAKPQRQLANRLNRKAKTIRKAIEKNTKQIPSEEQIDSEKLSAELLQQFSYLVKEESDLVVIDSIQSGLNEDVEIELNPDYSIGRNIEHYFTSVKKKKRGRELGLKQIERLQRELSHVESWVQKLREDEVLDLDRVAEEFKLKPQAKKSNSPEVATSYRAYVTKSGWRLLVGKGPKENDDLTKSAKGNDTWVHTISVPGAHVIIPKSNQPNKEKPPVDVIKAAAILTIHNSKLRQDMSGEVYVTVKGNLKKKKGMPPGLWLVERSESLFVKYDKDELQSLLDLRS